MTTYGPFYPALVVSGGGGVPWSNPGNAAGPPDGNSATADLGSSEAVTDLLFCTDYGVTLLSGAVVRAVRFFVAPAAAVEPPLNPSTKDMVGVGDPAELAQAGNAFRAEDDLAPTAAQVQGGAFGLALSIYGQAGGLAAVESVALYVEVE